MQNLDLNQASQSGDVESLLHDQYFSQNDSHDFENQPEQADNIEKNSEKQLETQIQEQQIVYQKQENTIIPSQISQFIKRKQDQNYWKQKMEESLMDEEKLHKSRDNRRFKWKGKQISNKLIIL